MDSSSESSNEILHYFPPFIRVYKDGRIERLLSTGHVSAGYDPYTDVLSKDVVISPETDLSARLYIPNTTNLFRKLPLLIYFHGGGFVIESASSPTYQNFLNLFAAGTNVLVVSVNYRLAPEFPLPIGYDDSWDAIKWVVSHADGSGEETWLNKYGDFNQVSLAGDSAGGNIAHNMAIRAGLENLVGLNLTGLILLHPFFWGKDPIGKESDEFAHLKCVTDKLWLFACSGSSGSDDPFINPDKNPNLSKLGCRKVLICVAEKDNMRDRGWYYEQVLCKSGWGGKVEVMEAKGEEHVFFLFNLTCESTLALLKKMASFIYQS